MVAHACNPSTQEDEAGGLSSRPACATQRVPYQLGLYSETLSQNPRKQTNKQRSTHRKQLYEYYKTKLKSNAIYDSYKHHEIGT
jgi:hypothetical protein